MALMAVALWRGLPKVKSETHLNYPQLLGSVFSLFIHDGLLRTRALLGCLTFANFSILWTSMAFLLAAPPFNYSEGMIGLFGLAGAAGALGARPAGGFADKGKSHLTTTFGLLLLLLSWLAIWYGHSSVLALIIGILVLDLTVQGVHITNQTVIYRVHPDARNRLTAGYMTSYFIGGAAGSLISASALQHAGCWRLSGRYHRRRAQSAGLVARFSPTRSRKLSRWQAFTFDPAPQGVKASPTLLRLYDSFMLVILTSVTNQIILWKALHPSLSPVRQH